MDRVTAGRPAVTTGWSVGVGVRGEAPAVRRCRGLAAAGSTRRLGHPVLQLPLTVPQLLLERGEIDTGDTVALRIGVLLAV